MQCGILIVFVCVCRSMAVRLETEVAELRRNLQQAVNQKLEAENEKEDAQDQVNKYTPDLGDTALANNLECLFKAAGGLRG